MKKLPKELVDALDKLKTTADLCEVLNEATQAVSYNFNHRFDKWLANEKRKRIVRMRWVVRAKGHRDQRTFDERRQAEVEAEVWRDDDVKGVTITRITTYRKEKP